MISIDLSQCRRRSTLDDFMRQGSIWTGVRALEPFPIFDTFSPVQLDMFMG